MQEEQPWYLLTNLPNLLEAITAYKKRVGIEAMFKDCKSGGYNERRLKGFYRKGNSASLINRYSLYILNFKRTINKGGEGKKNISVVCEKSRIF